jgi:DNA-binding CsgD family transcriptional regulator
MVHAQRDDLVDIHSEVRRRFARLNGRERKVMGLVADGLSSEPMSELLNIQPRTAQSYLNQVKYKMGADSIVSLYVMARICRNELPRAA